MKVDGDAGVGIPNRPQVASGRGPPMSALERRERRRAGDGWAKPGLRSAFGRVGRELYGGGRTRSPSATTEPPRPAPAVHARTVRESGAFARLRAPCQAGESRGPSVDLAFSGIAGSTAEAVLDEVDREAVVPGRDRAAQPDRHISFALSARPECGTIPTIARRANGGRRGRGPRNRRGARSPSRRSRGSCFLRRPQPARLVELERVPAHRSGGALHRGAMLGSVTEPLLVRRAPWAMSAPV
jgi:hypothetical protein